MLGGEAQQSGVGVDGLRLAAQLYRCPKPESTEGVGFKGVLKASKGAPAYLG